MIVRMTKVEVAGPKELLFGTIEAARHLGVLHLESDPLSVAGPDGLPLSSLQLPEKAFEERVFFEELPKRLPVCSNCCRLFRSARPTCTRCRFSISSPPRWSPHLQLCQQQRDRLAGLEEEEKGLDAFRGLLQALEPLLADMDRQHGLLDVFGVSFKANDAASRLSSLLEELFDGLVIMTTATTPSGELVGIVAIVAGRAAELRHLLETEEVPELSFPEAFKHYSFPEKVRYLQDRLQSIKLERARLEQELAALARSWRPIYQRALSWLSGRLETMQASAAVFETGMCFVMVGWLPEKQLDDLQQSLEQSFKGRVTLETIEILESDQERIPVALMNPAYFKPFERFTSLLPLPRYSSFDPTPFLGIFFPLFFGMMLGDIGYGVVLLIITFGLLLRHGPPLLLDAARILGSCAVMTTLFGILYGELFGDWGTQALGLHPILFERSQAIVPMLYFSVSVGAMHILLGMVLGLITAWRRHLWKKSVLKLLEITMIVSLCLLLIALILPETGLDTRSLLLLVGAVVPLMVLLGGLLAPLELLKTVGNIVSYARIMAIGTTSVLLAVIANRLGGMTGDIVAGLLVAGVLHAFNLILGVFAPTIHSLRLHYVEFFGKFLESGGRRFSPLDEKSHH